MPNQVALHVVSACIYCIWICAFQNSDDYLQCHLMIMRGFFVIKISSDLFTLPFTYVVIMLSYIQT
jgi:hypothetical protein